MPGKEEVPRPTRHAVGDRLARCANSGAAGVNGVVYLQGSYGWGYSTVMARACAGLVSWGWSMPAVRRPCSSSGAFLLAGANELQGLTPP